MAHYCHWTSKMFPGFDISNQNKANCVFPAETIKIRISLKLTIEIFSVRQ